MKQQIVKSSLVALLVSGALAGCATTVDWGGPLLHYRYNYECPTRRILDPGRGAGTGGDVQRARRRLS